MAAIIKSSDGQYQFEFEKKAGVIDPKNLDDTISQLISMIVDLDLRVQELERKMARLSARMWP